MESYYKTAQNFWEERRVYPQFPSMLRRRFIDLTFVLNYAANTSSILDLGCGDGYLLFLLRELTQIKDFYAYDMSTDLMNELNRKWFRDGGKCLYNKTTNFIEEEIFPQTELTVCFGSFPFIFEVKDLESVLEKINSPKLLVRSPCSVDGDSVLINKFSEELCAEYSAIYRTPGQYFSILSEYFEVEEMVRSYPDDIESKYGTKHFFFMCKK